MDEIGKTTGGRPYLLVTISTPDTLRALEEARAAQHRLADPRVTTDVQAERIARDHKAVVLIGAGVHSNETGSAQAVNELVWRLATERSPAIDHLLRNLVVLVVPSQNPDGLQMMAEWQARNAGTPYADAPLPELYHPYAGHDNNRDGFMQTQRETQHLSRLLYRDWLPEVYLDLHQMGPTRARVFVPPYRNPANPNIDPHGVEPGQSARPDDGHPAPGGRQDRRAVGRDLQRLLAGRQQHDAVVAQHHRDAQRSRQRATDHAPSCRSRRAPRRAAWPFRPNARRSRRSWGRPRTCSSA